MSQHGSGRRSVRSFVRRAGRMTPGQERALRDLWPTYGIGYSATPIDLDRVFGRTASRVFEIGFGNGETLVRDAAAAPDKDFIGVEVHEPGIGHCLMRARDLGINNLRVIAHDAVEVLREQIADEALSRINLFFPDPWPKKRHHKRRLVQASFLALAAARLEPGGRLHIATDWENYAEHIDELIEDSREFTLVERYVHDGCNELSDRETTKFEQRGLAEGRGIWDWRLAKS
ncbi:MAG: tRNA (guanosine(46)-N7)-methyltransferase TrmB [Woeseiaceae bacterium]|nr:tRNA (guanosine(46)-N7)-methyltransferase TrmB [Woeseiaceae bacterium]